MDKKILTEMFDNLLHIGNKTNYWNPQMKSYIYGSTNGVHIIDLTKTVTELESVISQLQVLNADGKKILFVATKLQSRAAFAKLAIESGNYFVTEKWVPGLLTNFKTIKKRISTYLKLLRDSQGSGFDMLTKKEKAWKMLELEKLDKAFKWVKDMKRAPDVLFVVDGVYEGQAVKEAKSLGIPCFSISNTNGDPYKVQGVIPANTNSVKSLDYLAAALLEGFKSAPKKSVAKKDVSKIPAASHEKTTTPVVEKEQESKQVPPKNSTKSDDLTKIEGIGPKIAEALVAGKIISFADLAKADSGKITELIADVRGNHVPDTWPQQATMAAEGKWDELKKLQDELDGGKPTVK